MRLIEESEERINHALSRAQWRIWSRAHSWETILLSILAVELILLRIFMPELLNPAVLLGISINFMEAGIITLPMVLVIISKNIDVSVGSIIALVSVIIALCIQSGLREWQAMGLALVAGSAAGFVNGVLTTKFRIPSLVVTLGTYSLYRGIAYVILGDQTYHQYSDSFINIGRGNLFSIVPVPLVVFAILAIAFAFTLHKTTFGRKVYAIGNNQKATLYSGIRVDRIVTGLFTLMGLVTAIASIILTSRNASTRGNMALGMELDVITATVLGGAVISGGKGTIAGAVISVFVIGLLRNGLYAQSVSPEIMKIVTGGLLIMSLLMPRLVKARGKLSTP
jgi:rhamnose transport system permease protein